MSTEHTYMRTPPSNPPTTTHHDISTMLAREPCAGCGAPLGADQRYCLSCGLPRPGTRLPFLDVLHAEATSVGVLQADAPPAALLRIPALGSGRGAGASGWSEGGRGASARLQRQTGLFALTGVLLLVLLIGLLLGHWVSNAGQSVAAAPSRQVIEVKIPTIAAAAPATSAPSLSAAGSTTGTAPSESPSPSEATQAAHTTHASNPTVSKLATSTGKEHAKEVEKALSKNGGALSTGGAAPPKETSKAGATKPIGGGSEVTSIE
jgi:hypothetical protein